MTSTCIYLGKKESGEKKSNGFHRAISTLIYAKYLIKTLDVVFFYSSSCAMSFQSLKLLRDTVSKNVTGLNHLVFLLLSRSMDHLVYLL